MKIILNILSAAALALGLHIIKVDGGACLAFALCLFAARLETGKK